MNDESKGKIQIKPKLKQPYKNPDVEQLKKEVKALKKQLGRLLNIAEHEEQIVEENQGKNMTLKLSDGSEETGLLKDITKFQIILDQDGIDTHFYKSAVIKYSFK